jgi:LacI family transcriptional regulator
MAADYLANLGHTRIATVTGSLQTQSGAHRLEGFKTGLLRKNNFLRDEYFVVGDYSRRSARIAAEKFLSLNDRPTAVFAASDEMAMEIIAVFLERGLRVPLDISVIGYDDNPAGLYGPISLTTIKQPLFEMAETAVKHLNAIITGKKRYPVHEILSPQLIVRDSCGVPIG